MRLMRPMSANKENAEPVLGETERNRREEGRKELKSAYLQITALMRSNKELTKRAQERENELQLGRAAREELEFMREQEHNTRQQLLNYEEINAKLRQQLERVQQENQGLKRYASRGQVPEEMENRSTSRQYFNKPQELCTASRASYQNRLNSSLMSDRPKSNHSSTPKAKMQINWGELMPGPAPERRRVFM